MADTALGVLDTFRAATVAGAGTGVAAIGSCTLPPVMSLTAALTPSPAALIRSTVSVIGLISGINRNGAGTPGLRLRS